MTSPSVPYESNDTSLSSSLSWSLENKEEVRATGDTPWMWADILMTCERLLDHASSMGGSTSFLVRMVDHVTYHAYTLSTALLGFDDVAARKAFDDFMGMMRTLERALDAANPTSQQ